MKSEDLKAAFAAVVREANTHGATLTDISQLIKLLKQQAREDEAPNESMDVPPDPPKAA